jgi:RNA-binding protein NOB1
MSFFTPHQDEEWVTPSEVKKGKKKGKKDFTQKPIGAWTKPLDNPEPIEPAVQPEVHVERVVPQVTEVEQQSSFAFSKNKVIVVDTGAIVYRAVQLERFGSEFVTTEAVLAEIRDSKSKYILATLPFELKLREPSRDSIRFVSDYAKRTGDFANLSVCDLEILALTYELELEINGNKNIKPLPQELPISGFHKVKLQPYSNLYKKDEQGNEQTEEPVEEHTHEEPAEENVHEDEQNAENQQVNDSQEEHEHDEEEDTDSDDSCDDEWITPDNLQEHKKKQITAGGMVVNSEMWDEPQPAPQTEQVTVDEDDDDKIELTEESETEGQLIHATKEVGCITVDFSMQNVLLHMGLNLISIDGRRIKYLTRYVKRCYGCSTLVPDTRRIFCPNCGIDSLKRVTCIVDSATGEANFYYNPRKQINNRGNKFPLPLPKGGRNNRDPVLCEDQLARFKRGMPKKKEQVLNRRDNNNDQVWQPEYSFEKGFQESSKPPKGRYHLGRNNVFNGYGRRNPNEVVKKTGRKKKSSRV